MKKVLSILLVVMSVSGVYECRAQDDRWWPSSASVIEIEPGKRRLGMTEEGRVQHQADIIASWWDRVSSYSVRAMMVQQISVLLLPARSDDVLVTTENGRVRRRYQKPGVVDRNKEAHLLNWLERILVTKNLPNFHEEWNRIQSEM